MSNLKAVVICILITLIIITLLILLTGFAFGFETELTREIPVSENLQADLRQAVSEMTLELLKAGCKEMRGMAYTTDAKPHKVIVVVMCADK